MTRLEQLRLDAHMTREQLAEKSGIPERTIRNIESGAASSAHDSTVIALARALKQTPSELALTMHEDVAA